MAVTSDTWVNYIDNINSSEVNTFAFKQYNTFGTSFMYDYPLECSENSYPAWFQYKIAYPLGFTIINGYMWLKGTSSENTVYSKTYVTNLVIPEPISTQLKANQASNSTVLPRNTYSSDPPSTEREAIPSSILSGGGTYNSPKVCLHLEVDGNSSLGLMEDVGLMVQYDIQT